MKGETRILIVDDDSQILNVHLRTKDMMSPWLLMATRRYSCYQSLSLT